MSAAMTALIVFAIGAALVAFLMWMMLTEWSYLGSDFVRRSYDWLAPWYEKKWKSAQYQSAESNRKLFVDPLLKAAGHRTDTKVLDLACGTGRVSLMLLDQNEFRGRIEAIDFSAGMLDRFRDHLSGHDQPARDRVALKQLDLGKWEPAEAGTWDAAVLMEAAELIPDLPKLVGKIASALKPGGTLVTTRVGKKFVWLFGGRHQRDNGMMQLLADSGLEVVSVNPWRDRYDVVIARRPASQES